MLALSAAACSSSADATGSDAVVDELFAGSEFTEVQAAGFVRLHCADIVQTEGYAAVFDITVESEPLEGEADSSVVALTDPLSDTRAASGFSRTSGSGRGGRGRCRAA